MTDLAKTTELVPISGADTSVSMQGRPDFLPQTSEGTEHLGREDVKFPTLAIAQGLSDQLKKSHPKFIQGLSVGQLFNDLTGEIYGEGPLEFFIVRADPPRWVQFKPREEGGGMIDPNVPHNDPRTEWTTDEKGERVKPLATLFYDYVLCLWPSREIIVLSLKSSGIKHAKMLNGLIMHRKPMWAGKYKVEVKEEPGPQGAFPNYSIKVAAPGRAGWVDTPEEGGYLQRLFVEFQGRVIDIEREQPVEESTTSTADAPEVVGEHIPF